MTDGAKEKKASSKAAKSKRGAGKMIATPLAYAAMHETNLALCLASGFLAPRHEKSAARDHHWRSDGRVIVTGQPVPAGLITSARGGLDYGNVVLAEIANPGVEAKTTGGQGQIELKAPLPLSCIKRALFRSDTEREEFLAKVSGYADVPAGIVEFAVDLAAFPVEEPTLGFFAEDSGSAAVHVVPQPYDKIAGAVIALLHHARSPGSSLSLELLRDVLVCAPGPGAPADIAGSLATALDPGGGKHGVLAARTVMELLVAHQPGTGFNPSTFLDELHGAVSKLPTSTGAPVDRFVEHAKDILAARKDISDDAHADAPGKIVSRALLLFLLNSDPEKLYSLRRRSSSNLGKAVYALSLFFSGAFKGLAGLPGSWKSEDAQAFLGVGELASKLFHGAPVSMSISQAWNAQGACKKILACGGYSLVAIETPPVAAIVALQNCAQELSWTIDFDPGNGDLSLDLGSGEARRMVRAKISRSPSFPRESVIELATVIGKPLAKKEATRIVGEINASASADAVFARANQSGKLYAVEVYSFVSPAALNKASLQGAVEAMVACEDKAAKSPNTPGQ